MTIKMEIRDLSSSLTVDIIRLCNKIILKGGNYGNYSSKDGKFSIILHLKELPNEINNVMALVEQNIVEFSCAPTEVEVTEDFGYEENEDEAQVEEEGTDITEVKTVMDGTVEDQTGADEKVEAVPQTETQIKENVEEKTENNAKQAVLKMMADVKAPKKPEEIAKIVINKLHFSSYFYEKSLDDIFKIVVAYVKAEKKPNSFVKLQKLAGFTIYGQKSKKLNEITRQVFENRYGVSVSFLEFLFYVCEKFSSEESEESDPEEVILQPPEKPPDKEEIKEPIGKLEDLPEFIQNLDSVAPLREKSNKLVNFMGLQEFEKHSQRTVEKAFFSIISNKQTDIEVLFDFDSSLKKVSTARGSMMVLRKFIGKFFNKEVDEKFVIEFFEDVISKLHENTSVQEKNPIKYKFETRTSKKETTQEPGEFPCFPKDKKFDSYIKSVKYLPSNKIARIHKILKYMKYNEESRENYKLIKKICCNLIIIQNLNYLDMICESSEIESVEQFLNKFAKTLKADANFVKLQDFLRCLKNLP